jgi:hypothetical protein
MKLTFEEFLDKYKDMWEYAVKSHSRYDKDYLKPDKDKRILAVSWAIGGLAGGSCYGTEHYPRDGEAEPDMEDLAKILEEVCPGITFLQYRKLGKLLKEYEHSSHDYYGNYTDYRTKYIEVQDLYNALNEMGLLNEED